MKSFLLSLVLVLLVAAPSFAQNCNIDITQPTNLQSVPWDTNGVDLEFKFAAGADQSMVNNIIGARNYVYVYQHVLGDVNWFYVDQFMSNPTGTLSGLMWLGRQTQEAGRTFELQIIITTTPADPLSLRRSPTSYTANPINNPLCSSIVRVKRAP